MIDVITCPHCQRRLALPPEHRECDVQCPGCKQSFHVGANAAPVPTEQVFQTAPPPVIPVAPEPPVAPPDDEPPLRRRPIVRRPPPPPTWRGKASALIIVGVAAVLGMCILLPTFLTWNRQQQVDAPPLFQQADTVQIAPGVEDPQLAQDLQPLFDQLSRAFRMGDSFSIVAQFDTERGIVRLVEQGVVAMPAEAARAREARDQALRHDLQTGFGVWAPRIAWSSAEILHVERLNADDVAVIIRHRIAATNTNVHMRWWLTRQAGAWDVYDMEDLGLGLCLSALTGVASEGHDLAEFARLRTPIDRLREAREAAVVRGDANTAERALQDIAAVELPPHLDAMRWAIAALVPMQRGEPKGVLEALAKARAHKVDLPVLDLFEAIGHNRAGQFAQAVPLLEAHAKLLGDDWETNRELGDALLGLGHLDRARSAFRKALDNNPQETGAFLGLLRALDADDAGDDLGPRLLKLNDPRQQFEKMSEQCRQTHDGRSLGKMAQAMIAVHGDSAPAEFALALANAWAEQADGAVAAFQRGLALEHDAGKRNGQTTLFLQAMAGSGLALRAYAAAPVQREAFQTLAAELKRAYHTDELGRLTAEHARRDPGDPLLPWYRGEVLVERGRYAQADKEFAAALAKDRDGRTADLFRHSRVAACYHTGKALAAYAAIGPARQTFQELAGLAVQDRDDVLLEKLIADHAKADPDDPELFRQQLHLKVRRGDVAGATALVRTALGRKQPDRERNLAVGDFLYSMANAGKALEAYAATTEVPAAFERLAEVLRNQNRVAELRQLIAAHRKQRAGDIWLEVYTGIAHLKEAKWADAARVLVEAWHNAPAKVRDRIRGDTVYALYKAGRLRDAYDRIEPKPFVFTQLANLLLADKKAADLLTLIEAHRPNAGGDAQVTLFEARARILENQPAQAIALWQDACRREPAVWKRRQMITTFVIAMHAAKRGLEAYRAAPDRRAAFEALARLLVHDKNTDELAKLLDERTRDPVTDPWLHFYNGEYRLLIGQPGFAERHFQAALKAAAPYQRWTFRRGLYRAQVCNGWAVAAYDAAGRTAQAFGELAIICQQEKNAAQLKAVIAAHRATDPDEPMLLSWDLQVLWMAGDYAGALTHLDAHADEFTHHPTLRYTGSNYRVRALVKLKRTAEAIRTAEAMEKRNRGNRLLLLLAYAAAGDAKGAIAVMERMPRQPYLVGSGYADLDLGPLLRSDPLRVFRERFPEPEPGTRDFDMDDDD